MEDEGHGRRRLDEHRVVAETDPIPEARAGVEADLEVIPRAEADHEVFQDLVHPHVVVSAEADVNLPARGPHQGRAHLLRAVQETVPIPSQAGVELEVLLELLRDPHPLAVARRLPKEALRLPTVEEKSQRDAQESPVRVEAKIWTSKVIRRMGQGIVVIN